MTWNAGGGAGTLTNPDKLSILCRTMLCQSIQVACINEGHASKESVKACLRELKLQHLFRTFGDGSQVIWLVQTALADRIVAQPPMESDRVSCLVLAGPCHQRTLLIGMYGYSSATTESRSGKRQQELWEHVEPFIRLNRERKHHVVVLGDLNVVPADHLSTSKNLLTTSIQQFEDWRLHLGLTNALLHRCPAATLSKGFFSRSKCRDTGIELALLDHILASPDIVRGAAILVLPAADRGCPWGDHDPVLADFEFGFNPIPLKPKRSPITWAHHYSPGEWAAHEADPAVNATLDTLLGLLEAAADTPDSVDLNSVFSDFLSVAAPPSTSRSAQLLDKPSTDPISTAAGRMLGRMRRAAIYIRSCLPRDRRALFHFNEPHLRELLFHPEDIWADPLEKAADLREALRYRHLKTGTDWCGWLTTMAAVQRRLQRVIKHHRVSWQRMRQDYEVTKATQEARAGRPQRAINLIFGKEGPTMVDGAFWKQRSYTDESGVTSSEWVYVTDEEEVEAEALRHVARMFPPELGWEPFKPGATFPKGYAFAGSPVVSTRLSHILATVDRVDFKGALDPMTLTDFDALLRKQNVTSSPGCSGITYGHLRAMGTKARRVCVLLINRYLRFQEAPAAWLEVGIALIPKSDGLAGLGDGRPISLLESLLKLSTAFVGPKLKTALLRHPSPHDPSPPARGRGRMHRQQLFDSGSRRGCQEAFIMLTAVLHGLRAQRKKFVLIMTDVKGAFNHTPTAYMDQRYEGLGIPHKLQIAADIDTDLEGRLRDFLQSIDRNSTFRVRTRHGFTEARAKGWVGLHQGETLSPSKYSWSVDPLLEYLEAIAESEGLGIDLGSILVDGEEVFFEGSYTIHTGKGDVTFFHQGGRLVAILFADDLAIISGEIKGAQVLLHATNEFYTSASATLCAPKSLYTASENVQEWSVALSGFDDCYLDGIEKTCRGWRKNRREALAMLPRTHEDIAVKGTTIILKGDPLILEHLGDPVHWLNSDNTFTPDSTFTLAGALLRAFPGVPIKMDVYDRPLHVVNALTGCREYLTYVPPHEPMKYLGIPICANLDWEPAHRALLAKLRPKLSKVKQGKRLGLPEDVFTQAASSHVMGILNYYLPPVPYSVAQLATINNLVTNAFRTSAKASVHQLRLPQPLGCDVPDVELLTAKLRIHLALRMLHSRDLEGQTLRWCLGVIQKTRKLPDFPWSTLYTPPPGQPSSFVDAVTTSLQHVRLCIRTDSPMYPCGATMLDPHWERGLRTDTPAWAREELAWLLRNFPQATHQDLLYRRNWPKFQDFQHFFVDTPIPELTEFTRSPLWRTKTMQFQSEPLPRFTAISDGTGDGVCGTCQLSDASDLATITRVYAGDTPCESELVGIMQSYDSLCSRNAPVTEGKILSDCQSAIALWQSAREPSFDPMLRTHGRAAVLQLYIALHQRHSPDSAWPCYWLPGHSDREAPESIAEEDQPYFRAHVVCDKLAPECKQIAPAGDITGFVTDFMFVLADATGRRCFQTLHSYIDGLRKSPDFHAAQTRKTRAHSTGHSWREIPTEDLYLPKNQTPWDSDQAYSPFKRNSFDCEDLMTQLLDLPALRHRALRGHGKATASCRVDILGGHFPLASPASGTTSAAGTCLFCHCAPVDTLHHALHECAMDRWASLLPEGWCSQAIGLIRSRYLLSEISAILQLGCPFDTSEPSPLASSRPRTDRKRRCRTMALVSYEEVARMQTTRSSAGLAQTVANKWFQAATCGIMGKQLAVAHMDRTPDKDQPAAQLMRAALAQQKSSLEEQRTIWRQLHPAEVELAADASFIEPVIGLESRSARALPDDRLPIGPHVQLEQCLKSWQPPWCETHPTAHATFASAWRGLPSTLLREQRHRNFWPRPREGTWLYAGVVTNSTHFHALSAYAVAHAIPILAVVGRDLLPEEAKTDCVEWPIPTNPVDPSACPSADYVQNLGTPGCIMAALQLLRGGGSERFQCELPVWLRLWPMLFDNYPRPADYPKWNTDRSMLRLHLSRELCTRLAPPWWRTSCTGVMGQAGAAGLWTKELGSQLRNAMPSRQVAQLYSSHYWHSGVLAASALSCRAATAAAIIAMNPPCLPAADRRGLQQMAYSPQPAARSAPSRQGWHNPIPNRVNLATVIDSSTGQPVVYTPPKKYHQLGSAKTMYQLLLRSAATWIIDNSSVGDHPDSAWAHWRQNTCCSSSSCPNAEDDVQQTGFVLPTGHLLCPSCFTDWEGTLLAKLHITRTEPCPRDAKGTCPGCTLATGSSRARIRHLLIRGHLRDLCYHFLNHLPANTSNQMVGILHRELGDLYSTLDRKYLLGIPARVYHSVLGWLGWHYKSILSQPITSMPPLDLDQSEHWASVCYNKLCAVDLRPVTQKVKRTQNDIMLAHVFDQAPALRKLHPTLVDHSGHASTLLMNEDGRGLLRKALELDSISLPEPADNSIGRQTDARCAICDNTDNDAWYDTDDGLHLYVCLACKRWWHLECLSTEDRDTTELADPNGRCTDCIAGKCYALNRILEAVRTETGQHRVLLEYLGYNLYELGKQSVLDIMDPVGVGALMEAYHRHAATRTTRSLLFCATALLDALDQDAPLKPLGLHAKLVHNDPKLYLISHASLADRGFSVGQANAYQMLATEHRLYIPFSLVHLLRDLKGVELPKVPYPHTRAPTVQEVVDHLTALTTNSLPLAIAHTIFSEDEWQGLGLLSGSRLSDIAATLGVFGARYEASRWISFLQAAIPGLTEQDAQWLVSLPTTPDCPLPASQQMPAPQRGNKRKTPDPEESNIGNKRSTGTPTPQSAPVRRSPRSHSGSRLTITSATVETDAPSSLAASHQALRPQLSQAFRRLYGTARHRGILTGLAILKLYCECLGTTWTGSPARDPIVFFRTPDMMDTRGWKRLPVEFDERQAKAFSFTRPSHSASQCTDRSSGLGPVHGRPP